ncbi:MAG: DUF1501 domain-containing protein [Gemmataceae bacterium]
MIHRRDFLRLGSLALSSIPAVLQAGSSTADRSARNKSVIMVYLTGGIAHQDTLDLKPHAPAESRGEFKPIATNVPGIQICELLPRLARCANRFAILRSLVGQVDEHSSNQSCVGFNEAQIQREPKPHFGSVVSRLQGPTNPEIPAFVDLFPTMQHKPYNSPGPGHLGRAARGVRVDGQDLTIMKLNEDLTERKKLLARLDRFQRQADIVGSMEANYRRAFEVLTTSKLVDAVDISREPVRVRDRYGRGSTKHLGDGAPMWNDQLLMARRLVEAGARVVTVAYGFWDTHGQNFRHLRSHLPLFDQGISALIEDIYERGLDRDCTVVVWGEFGRTPKINKQAGRDHWARVNSAIVAGGGMRVGQVIGSTDAQAAEAKNDPIHFRDVLATVYQNLGIDPHSMVMDVSNRPIPILPTENRPISKLIA